MLYVKMIVVAICVLVSSAAYGQFCAGGQCFGGGCSGGQCGVDDGYVAQPQNYVEYRTGGEAIVSKVMLDIYYGANGDKLWHVPVVNGYAPHVNVHRLCGGGTLTVYDYTRKLAYGQCKLYVEQTKVTQPVNPAPAPKTELAEPKQTKQQVVLPAPPVPVPAPKTELAEPKQTVVPAKPELVKEPAPVVKEPVVKPEVKEPAAPKVEMTSPLPPEPQKTSVPQDTRPKAPRMELFVPESDPGRVITPTYEER